MSAAIDGAAVPRLAPHVQLRFDAARQAWVVLAPERVLMPDEAAVAILRKIDGHKSLDAIVDELAAEFDAPRQEIAADTMELVQDLLARQVLQA